MDPYKVVLHPLISEKAVSLMEKDNVLIFIVSRNAKKPEIKEAIEKLYEVEVEKINTTIVRGKKKAFVKLKEEYLADEVATKIGVF